MCVVMMKWSEFSYKEGSMKGPSRWEELKAEWTACGNGSTQSPILLFRSRSKVVHNSHNLKSNYKPASASVLNKGYYIAVIHHFPTIHYFALAYLHFSHQPVFILDGFNWIYSIFYFRYFSKGSFRCINIKYHIDS